MHAPASETRRGAPWPHAAGLAKNSWGPRFAAGGFFRIAYSSNVGVGNPADTYGLKFTLNDASPADEALRFRLSPAPGGRPGCYRYAAAPSDYVSGVAAAFGLPIAQVQFVCFVCARPPGRPRCESGHRGIVLDLRLAAW